MLAFLALPAFAQSDPTAPRNLAAEIVDGGVALSWDAPAENAESVTGYQVLRRDPNNDAVGVFTAIENSTGDAATSYTDATATQAGQSYTYRVKAWRGADLSNWSNYARVDLPAEEEPTPTPTATPTPTPTPAPTPTPTPTATPTPEPEDEGDGPLTGFTLVDASDQSVLATLSDDITVVLDDPAGGDYAIRADVESGSAIGSVHLELTGAKTHSQTENVPPYSLYGDEGANKLTGGTLPVGSYELDATAYSQKNRGGDELGILSVSFTVSEAAPALTPPPPPTPTPEPEADAADLAPSNLAAVIADDGVNLTWDAPVEDAGDVTGYRILRAVGDGELAVLAADTESAATTYTDSTATEAGETYAYVVKAIRGEEQSQGSNRAGVQLPHGPEDLAPSNLDAEADDNGVSLAWGRPRRGERHRNRLPHRPGRGPGRVRRAGCRHQLQRHRHSDATAEAGNTYRYRVAAQRGSDPSAWSPEASVTLAPPAGLTPAALGDTLMGYSEHAGAGALTPAEVTIDGVSYRVT